MNDANDAISRLDESSDSLEGTEPGEVQKALKAVIAGSPAPPNISSEPLQQPEGVASSQSDSQPNPVSASTAPLPSQQSSIMAPPPEVAEIGTAADSLKELL